MTNTLKSEIVPDHSYLSILIVDDSKIERSLLRIKLEKLFYSVIEAESGYIALDILKEHENKIDLILLDVVMPNMNGFQTALYIRRNERINDDDWCPIIFTSTNFSPFDIEKGISSGGDDYIEKPLNIMVLRAKIRSMERISRIRKDLIDSKSFLSRIAYIDELTKIPNRRKIFEIVDTEIARANRSGTPFCIAILDIDHFKAINDKYGHSAGDTVLSSISYRLFEEMRKGDSIGRIGGEEFCICLPGSEINDFEAPCERYRRIIEKLDFNFNGKNIRITASFGVSKFIPNTDLRQDIINRADKALFHAKTSGRNKVVSR